MQCVRNSALGVCFLLGTGLALAADPPDTPKRDAPKDQTKKAEGATDGAQFIKKHDQNKDGYLQRDELPEEMREGFADLDLDKDGKLSRTELAKHAVHMDRQVAEAGWRQSVEAILDLIERMQRDDKEMADLQQVYDALRVLDKNNNGRLDREDLATAQQQIRKMRAENLVKRFDSDHDGKVSEKEARGMLKNNFRRFDEDRDGFVNTDEIRRGLAKLRANERTTAEKAGSDGQKKPAAKPSPAPAAN